MEIIQANWILAHRLWGNSCILPDGTLNELRAEYNVKIAKMCGATFMRFLPGLLIDTHVFPNWTPADMLFYNYLPWEFNDDLMLFELSKRNQTFIENLKKLCEILKRHGLGIIWSLYDRCHWNQYEKEVDGKIVTGRVPHSPFKWNRENVNGMFVRTQYHDAYENDVLDVLQASGCQFKIEFCNEPRVNARLYVYFTAPIYEKYKARGVEQNQFLSGLEWFVNGKVNDEYKIWRHSLGETGFTDSFEGGKKDIDVGYAVIHGFPEDFLENEHLVDAPRHSRRMYISNDGKTLNAAGYKADLTKYRGYERSGRLKNWAFEALYQGLGTDLYVCSGISLAFGKEIAIDYELKDPGNDPELIPVPQPPIPAPEPQPPAPAPEPKKKKSTLMRRILIGGGLGLLSVLLAMLHKPLKWPWIIVSIVSGVIGNIPWILGVYKQKVKK